IYDEEPPRSIFSALWFRALIVILVLGVIAAVAVPYVLDIVNPPVVKKTASAPPRPAAAPVAPVAPEPAATSPSLPPPSAPRAETSPAPVVTPPAPAAITGKPVEARKPATSTVKPGTDTPKMTMAGAGSLSAQRDADGRTRQVRRAGGQRAGNPSGGRAATSATSADTLYRVRVGGLADRAAALATLKELEGKGYKPFIGRGGS